MFGVIRFRQHLQSIWSFFCPDYHPYILCLCTAFSDFPNLWGGGGATVVYPSSHWAGGMDTASTAHQSCAGHAYHSHLLSLVN